MSGPDELRAAIVALKADGYEAVQLTWEVRPWLFVTEERAALTPADTHRIIHRIVRSADSGAIWV